MHNWTHATGYAATAIGGGGLATIAWFVAGKLFRGVEFIVNIKELFVPGKNGHTKLTVEKHELICNKKLDIVTKDIALHTQRINDIENHYAESREDARKDHEELVGYILDISSRIK